jgi:DNA-3-methyladenine glycosylase I
MQDYHDTEWGVPMHDSRALWEMLVLEGFQAGLSWRTILHRREGFRAAFSNFDPERVARFDENDIERLMANPEIIRARAKIEATINNARVYLQMAASGEDFSALVWDFIGGQTLIGDSVAVPVSTPLSQQLSAEFKRRGFKFIGAVTVYAWMQAVGMVNDHALGCYRRSEVGGAGR